ncbi:type VI secretion protein IcmF/TssM N-terminal domain-containing protein [Cronobacter malonaticus]|uniref:type VI secretion protein IcmF/TssM N-terminal domain-containing protein n=1 Tax=Cronobacter malonaticus TaxID=413503 RepID=UPI003D15FDEB
MAGRFVVFTSQSRTAIARLEELRTTLGACFPVYLIVTKLDELAGFDAWFRHLTAQEREQVWGVTFPWGGTKGHSTPECDIEDELRLLEKANISAFWHGASSAVTPHIRHLLHGYV